MKNKMKFPSIFCLILILPQAKASEFEYTISDPCTNEYPFHSIETCRCYCFISPGTERLCKAIDWDRMLYKSVYLEDTEYEIMPNETLLLTLSLGNTVQTQFTNEEYFILDNKLAVLCLRLNPELFNCTKTTIENDKFEFTSDKSAVLARKKFPIDSYVANEIGIEVCFTEIDFIATETTRPYTISEPCSDGETFDAIETCTCYCFFNTPDVNMCTGIDYDVLAYKSVYLKDSEYVIMPNKTLALFGKTRFSQNEYFILANDTVVLCLRLNPEFENCTKTTIENGQFQFGNDKSAHAHETFAIDSYVKSEFGIDVCSTENDLNDASTEIEGPLYTISAPCNDGETFDTNESCACYCFFNTPNVKCNGVNYDITLYKSVYLKDSEYVIMPNETLILFGKKHFTKKEYFILTNNTYNIVLCYSLRAQFDNCSKNNIEWDEVEFLNDKTAYVTVYDKYYDMDSYSIFNDGIIICKNQSHHTISKLAAIAHACSAIFLFLTFILAIFLLNRQSNFALIRYLPMLCLFSILYAIGYYYFPIKSRFACPLLPLLTQYCILSAFIWMNLHVYSIFSSFSKLQATVHKTAFALKYRLICYFCAFGIPLIVCSITLTVDLLDVPLKPNFIDKCGYAIDGSSYLYEHGLSCLSLLLNVAFFIVIVFRARKLAKDASSVNKDATKQMCFVAAKLIVIMGFCYITRLIFYGVRVWGSVWEYLDIISALQGVYIFLVYICSVRTLKLLKTKVRKGFNLRAERLSSGSTTTNCSKEVTP